MSRRLENHQITHQMIFLVIITTPSYTHTHTHPRLFPPKKEKIATNINKKKNSSATWESKELLSDKCLFVVTIVFLKEWISIGLVIINSFITEKLPRLAEKHDTNKVKIRTLARTRPPHNWTMTEQNPIASGSDRARP